MSASALLAFKSRKDWTAEDSAREMKRWLSNAPPMDPAVRTTLDSLAENMWFFLETIRGRVSRYQQALDEVKAANPNSSLLSAEEAEGGLRLPNESDFLTLHIRRYIVKEDEEEEEKEGGEANEAGSPKKKKEGNEATAKADESDPTSSETKVAEEGGEGATTDATATAEEEADDEEDEEDEDDDDAYDCVEAIPVTFPDNKALVLRMAQLKQAGTELLTVFNGIADWISLSVPDIKVDDNDSVDVMNTVLETTQSYIEAIETTKTFHREYLDERVETETSILKFPHSASMRRSLLATDLDCWNEVERGWQTLTRCSLILHTLLSNNMKKLVDPRGVRKVDGIYQ